MDKVDPIEQALAVERGRILDKLEVAYRAGDLTEDAYNCACACVLIDDHPLTAGDMVWAEKQVLPILQGVFLPLVDRPALTLTEDDFRD